MSHRKGFPATPAWRPPPPAAGPRMPSRTLTVPTGGGAALPGCGTGFPETGPQESGNSHRDTTVHPGPKEHGAHPRGPGGGLAATHTPRHATPHATRHTPLLLVTLAQVPLSTHRVGPAPGRPGSTEARWPRATPLSGGRVSCAQASPPGRRAPGALCRAWPGRGSGRVRGPQPVHVGAGRGRTPPAGSDPSAPRTGETRGKETACRGPAGRSHEARGRSARPARPLLGTRPGHGRRARTAGACSSEHYVQGAKSRRSPRSPCREWEPPPRRDRPALRAPTGVGPGEAVRGEHARAVCFSATCGAHAPRTWSEVAGWAGAREDGVAGDR